MGIGDSLSISELCILPYAVLAALLRRRGGSATMTDRIESAEALAERLEFSAEKLNSDTAERARFIEADRAAVRADERAKALLMGEPWPLPDIVRKLANATQHLLGDHSGYESVVVALDAAREWLRALPGFPTEEEAAPQKPTRCTATNFYPGCVKEGE
jgi:hypothetical protein